MSTASATSLSLKQASAVGVTDATVAATTADTAGVGMKQQDINGQMSSYSATATIGDRRKPQNSPGTSTSMKQDDYDHDDGVGAGSGTAAGVNSNVKKHEQQQQHQQDHPTSSTNTTIAAGVNMQLQDLSTMKKTTTTTKNSTSKPSNSTTTSSCTSRTTTTGSYSHAEIANSSSSMMKVSSALSEGIILKKKKKTNSKSGTRCCRRCIKYGASKQQAMKCQGSKIFKQRRDSNGNAIGGGSSTNCEYYKSDGTLLPLKNEEEKEKLKKEKKARSASAADNDNYDDVVGTGDMDHDYDDDDDLGWAPTKRTRNIKRINYSEDVIDDHGHDGDGDSDRHFDSNDNGDNGKLSSIKHPEKKKKKKKKKEKEPCPPSSSNHNGESNTSATNSSTNQQQQQQEQQQHRQQQQLRTSTRKIQKKRFLGEDDSTIGFTAAATAAVAAVPTTSTTRRKRMKSTSTSSTTKKLFEGYDDNDHKNEQKESCSSSFQTKNGGSNSESSVANEDARANIVTIKEKNSGSSGADHDDYEDQPMYDDDDDHHPLHHDDSVTQSNTSQQREEEEEDTSPSSSTRRRHDIIVVQKEALKFGRRDDDGNDDDEDVVEWEGLSLPTQEELMVEIGKLVPIPNHFERLISSKDILAVLDRFCDWTWTERSTSERLDFLRLFRDLAGIQRAVFFLKQNTRWSESVVKVTQFLAWCFVVVNGTRSENGTGGTTQTRSDSDSEVEEEPTNDITSVSMDLARTFIASDGIHVLLLAVEDVQRYDFDSRMSARALASTWLCIGNVLPLTKVKECICLGVMDAGLDVLADLGSSSVSGTSEATSILQSIITTLRSIVGRLKKTTILEVYQFRDFVLTTVLACRSIQKDWIGKKDAVRDIVGFLSHPTLMHMVTKHNVVDQYTPMVTAIVERYSDEPEIFQHCFVLLEIAGNVLNLESLKKYKVIELFSRLQFAEDDSRKSKVDTCINKLLDATDDGDISILI
jgi:hypothetical protein